MKKILHFFAKNRKSVQKLLLQSGYETEKAYQLPEKIDKNITTFLFLYITATVCRRFRLSEQKMQ
jgi:hypothetical protein